MDTSYPILQVATLGQLGHGKTTLSAALSTVLGRLRGDHPFTVAELDAQLQPGSAGVMGNVARVRYHTATRFHDHADCPTHLDTLKNLLTGQVNPDVALLVVDALEGPRSGTREQLALALELGIQRFVVFLNKCELAGDEAALAQREAELRDFLFIEELPGDEIPVVRGSALGALQGEARWEESILELGRQLDTLPQPATDQDKPFLLAVDSVADVAGRGVVAGGRVLQGAVKVGDAIEIVGVGHTLGTTVASIDYLKKLIPEARAGQSVGVALSGVRRADLTLGKVLAQPGSAAPHARYECHAYLYTGAEGGRDGARFNGFRAQLHFRNSDVTGMISLPAGLKELVPGAPARLQVTLVTSVALDRGTRFTLREGGRAIGAGMVTRVSS